MEKCNIEQEIQKNCITFQYCYSSTVSQNPLINTFDLISKKKNNKIPSVWVPLHVLGVCAESRINRGSYFKICGLYVSGTWSLKSCNSILLK